MNIKMIEAAYARISPFIVKTPLLTSAFLDELAGRPVFVKAEALQHTGSFKYRGARAAVGRLVEEGSTTGVVAFSSGNHAQGVARVARELGLPAVIVMPADAPRLKIANTQAFGAEVMLYDRAGGSQSREALGVKVAQERGFSLIKPFDDGEVIAGQGSAGLEIASDLQELGIENAEIFVCCGGGGLTAGIALALEARAPEMVVRPVEPAGFDDVLRSLRAGERCRNTPGASSICDAIVTPSPGELTFPILHRLCGKGLAYEDGDVRWAMRIAFERLKLVLEPGGAIALAAALRETPSDPNIPVVAVATGGNVDAKFFAGILEEECTHEIAK